jgi:hypothetical protein
MEKMERAKTTSAPATRQALLYVLLASKVILFARC